MEYDILETVTVNHQPYQVARATSGFYHILRGSVVLSKGQPLAAQPTAKGVGEWLASQGLLPVGKDELHRIADKMLAPGEGTWAGKLGAFLHDVAAYADAENLRANVDANRAYIERYR